MKDTVEQEDIEKLIREAKVETKTMGQKTTFVMVTLKNGFVLSETSSCVDPANYDEKVGERAALGRITSRLWELEGYRLQQRVYEAGEHHV